MSVSPAGPSVSAESGLFGGPRRRMEHPRIAGLSAVEVLRSAEAAGRSVACLHSARPEATRARFSVLACAGESLVWPTPAGVDRPAGGDPFELLEAVAGDGALWLGFLGYDLAREVERLPVRAARDRAWPQLAFHRCAGWLERDELEETWRACGELAAHDDDAVLRAFGLGSVSGAGALADLAPGSGGFRAGPAEPDRPEREHLAAVERALGYIAAGDVFQVNLARRWGGSFEGSTAALYGALAASAEPWYGAHLPCPGVPGLRDAALCSASPELFLTLSPDGGVVTRPIKGTEPTGEQSLERSAKDAAELAMIVDLLRNDLGRVCEPGTMGVPEKRSVEEHPTVRHGVATVSGRLRAGCGPAALLRATWPGGSITGAPKVRAMEIIEELEPVRRGPAYGAIGGLRRESPGGGGAGWRLSLNLAIRTVCVANGRFDFHVGGGIVADSQAAAELAETRVKAEAMLRSLRAGRRTDPPEADRVRP